MKKCNICGEDRIEEFYAYQKTRCKVCVRAKQLERNKKNPNYVIDKAQRRRAKMNALPNDMKAEHWKAVQECFGNKCCLTGSTDVSCEHVVPISWGRMGHTITNVIPLDKTLNLSRQDKNFFEWFNTIDATLEMYDRFDEVIEYLAELNGLTVDEYWEFVYWCDDNKRRTVEEIEADTKSSVELFKELGI